MPLNIGLPQRRQLQQIQQKYSPVPINQIIDVKGEVPGAAGLMSATNSIGAALATRRKQMQDAQQARILANMAGIDVPVGANLTPDMVEKLAPLIAAKRKAADEAEKEQNLFVNPTTNQFSLTMGPGYQPYGKQDRKTISTLLQNQETRAASLAQSKAAHDETLAQTRLSSQQNIELRKQLADQAQVSADARIAAIQRGQDFAVKKTIESLKTRARATDAQHYIQAGMGNGTYDKLFAPGGDLDNLEQQTNQRLGLQPLPSPAGVSGQVTHVWNPATKKAEVIRK